MKNHSLSILHLMNATNQLPDNGFLNRMKGNYLIIFLSLFAAFLLAFYLKEAFWSITILKYYQILLIMFVVSVLFLVLHTSRYKGSSIEREVQMDAIFLNDIQGIVITDMEGTILRVNPYFEKMFDYVSNEIMGSKIETLFSGVDICKESKSRENAKFSFRKDLVVKRKNGIFLPVEIRISSFRSGNSFYAVAFINDISARKQEEEILRSEMKALRDANKELEAFSYSVSHDLKAPLRVICGYACSIEEDYSAVLDDEGKRCLRRITRSVEEMNGLIDDLLRFSMLGKKEIKRACVDMTMIANNALLEINMANQHRAEVIIHPLEAAMANSKLITQVMVNILHNAIKYSSKKPNAVIQIRSVEINEEVIYSIQDNGAGFNMKYQHKLFNAFQRLHSKEQFEGTGVGLAIVKRIIQKHGGRIWAEGKEGVGATFYFSLPLPIVND